MEKGCPTCPTCPKNPIFVSTTFQICLVLLVLPIPEPKITVRHFLKNPCPTCPICPLPDYVNYTTSDRSAAQPHPHHTPKHPLLTPPPHPNPLPKPHQRTAKATLSSRFRDTRSPHTYASTVSHRLPLRPPYPCALAPILSRRSPLRI